MFKSMHGFILMTFILYVGWLVRNRDTHSDKKAYCILCAKPLRAHITDLKTHKDRDVHIKKAENIDVTK